MPTLVCVCVGGGGLKEFRLRFLAKMWGQRHSPLIGSPEHHLYVSEAWHESPGDLVKNPELLSQ